jgi:hypothetical protein
MKNFYIKRSRFANVYDLAWAETEKQTQMALQQGYERIPRSEAFSLCAAERRRRKRDPYFSGYASTVILPIDYPEECDWPNDHSVRLNQYIVERVKEMAC